MTTQILLALLPISFVVGFVLGVIFVNKKPQTEDIKQTNKIETPTAPKKKHKGFKSKSKDLETTQIKKIYNLN